MITIDTALNMLGRDKAIICYRPEFKALTGSVTASILLQQIFYRWNPKREPFYKFKSPCQHKDYKTGDSWTEELGFSENEFDTALSKIAVKVKKHGERPTDALVWFWIDNERATFYEINKQAFGAAIIAIYEGNVAEIGRRELLRDEKGHFVKADLVNPQHGVTKTDNTGLRNHHDTDLRNPVERVYHPYSTNNTTDNTTNNPAPNGAAFDEEDLKDFEKQLNVSTPITVLIEQEPEKPLKGGGRNNKNTSKQSKWNGSFQRAKDIFDTQRKAWMQTKKGVEGEGVYWNAKECGQFSNFLTALKTKATEAGQLYESDSDFVERELSAFLEAAASLEKYYMSEFTPTRFYSNFNTLYTDVKSFFKNGNTSINRNGSQRIGGLFMDAAAIAGIKRDLEILNR